MKIKNHQQLINNATNNTDQKLRTDALKILEQALSSVDPKKAIQNSVSIHENILRINDKQHDLSKTDHIIVVGGGKAAPVMTETVLKIIGDRVSGGSVNVLRGTVEEFDLKTITVHEASHPIPDQAGVKGVQNMIELVSGLTEKDIVLTLISGGGSALMPFPANGISLGDMQEVTRLMLMTGATINELNAVRKHLSAFKGGQFARACYPASVVSLIISDVIGDPVDTIASGPTAPDSTTFNDATNALTRYTIIDKVPRSVKEHLLSGVNGKIPETPKKDDPIFKNVFNYVIANNLTACKAAQQKAKELGYDPIIVSTSVEGQACNIGREYADIVKQISETNSKEIKVLESIIKVKNPSALILGGETTVTVKGSGIGGRNQEVALSAIPGVSGLNCVLAALGTDGIDGPTDAAGAIIDGTSLERSISKNLDVETYLESNNAYVFFKELGDLIFTGPTGTNVNDITLILTI